MPIDMEEFETGSEALATERKNYKDDVVKMLKKKKAFSCAEIAAKLEVRPPQARSVLMQLMKDGLVERKKVTADDKTLIYYAWIRGAKDAPAEE